MIICSLALIHDIRSFRMICGMRLSSSAMRWKASNQPARASAAICLGCGSAASKSNQRRARAMTGLRASTPHAFSSSRRNFEARSSNVGRSITEPSALRYFSAFEQQNTSDGRYEAGSDFPRPAVIPFQKNLANSIHLIGHIEKAPDIRYLESGKVCARSSIAVRKSTGSDDRPSWFALEFWDELAEIAAHHLKKGDQIHVAGVVVVEKYEEDQNQVTIVKVVVRNVNYVDLPTKASADIRAEKEKLWKAFFENPSDWWDNRIGKINVKAPDFKHKTSGEALWTDSAPQWVKSQIEGLDSNRALGGNQA